MVLGEPRAAAVRAVFWAAVGTYGGEERRTTIAQPVTPLALPDALLAEAVSVKLIWLYLCGKGIVSYSSYKLAEALGLSRPSATFGLARLRDREYRFP